ncbi:MULTISPECIES: tyrosine-protein kinase [Streptococcus]|uniref:Tyrosine-protein kinase CpsD n=2 Tax=Streptococcus parauberis TaxID=1348 RepID=A0A0S3TG69_9STRE|nr:tyrosine-protein kinase [Streptococcus parauberis]AUT06289.1 Tyrosine-protein kinase CpsD [Streptococcus parauberis]EMF49998.1 Tyrosine-protein kinase [Streptococcus parauberis KRS-02109]EMG25702.1 Tyrosine-protein kinase [Streptococcus parauberis KRS-02083]MDT2732469.1 tyrosine-protein kinase [Streptococcus parauberis]UWM86179.1 tyrosine-protein kinase [Streptococcus parauberis]
MARLELVKSKKELYDIAEEYYNSIRTNIQFSGRDLKVITLTSVQPGEGKSTLSANIAISFAKAGLKTLLIDADIRNSVMSGTFKADEKYEGLSSYLSGNAELSAVISHTNIENLMLIPAGHVPPNPTTLLQNSNFNFMIDTVKELFDYVIIDTPPIGLVIDSAIISQKADANILVTEAGAIKRRFIQKAKEQMEQSGALFLGVILNKVEETLDSYGGYGSYGAYGNYGKPAKKKSRKRR